MPHTVGAGPSPRPPQAGIAAVLTAPVDGLAVWPPINIFRLLAKAKLKVAREVGRPACIALFSSILFVKEISFTSDRTSVPIE